MRLSSIIAIAGLAAVFTAAPRASFAQGWTNGSYSVDSYIYQIATGTGASYTISWETNDGLAAATAGSIDSGDTGTGCGEAQFAVAYTWHGGSPTGNLVLTAKGDLKGLTDITGGGTSSGWAYVGTDSAGALSNTQYCAPNFNLTAAGIKTTFVSPASPYGLLIIGGAQATYSGDANTTASSKVYFTQG